MVIIEAKANLKEALKLFFETFSKEEILVRLHDKVYVTNLGISVG